MDDLYREATRQIVVRLHEIVQLEIHHYTSVHKLEVAKI